MANYDEAYELMRGYLPPNARAKLAEAVPRIERAIDAEMDKFGKELGAYIASQTDELVRKLSDEAKGEMEAIRARTDALNQFADAEQVTEFRAAVRNLKEELDRYEKRWRQAGEKLRAVAIQAARTSGVPLP